MAQRGGARTIEQDLNAWLAHSRAVHTATKMFVCTGGVWFAAPREVGGIGSSFISHRIEDSSRISGGVQAQRLSRGSRTSFLTRLEFKLPPASDITRWSDW
jgi:hypothetical protein